MSLETVGNNSYWNSILEVASITVNTHTGETGEKREKPALLLDLVYGWRVSVRAVPESFPFLCSCHCPLLLRSPVIDRLVEALGPQPSINGGSAFRVTTRSIGGSRWRWRWSGLHVQVVFFREMEATLDPSSPVFMREVELFSDPPSPL
ncbi:hypothetical protein F2Q70_00015838 [Brassica cretica]|uniref:Uncharacterized protein n=1 Tax=Brassica cretica TaxID=69181 RepID=A0A8S9HSX5_BRACR|nr:hypothetical protein F2Q70_00015838 [Brassica cretica]